MEKPQAKIFTFEEILSKDGYLIYTNVGTSMLPLLRQRRDIIEIRPLQERPKRYDVVLYKRDGQYILHRVLQVLPEGYVIAGDNNAFVEQDVTDDMILGVTTRVIRDGKSLYPTDWRYRLYVGLWCRCWPARMAVLRGLRVLRRLGNRNKNGLKPTKQG